MDNFDFASIKNQVSALLPEPLRDEMKFYETYDKKGNPHLLIYTNKMVLVHMQLNVSSIYIRYYHYVENILEFLGSFYDFIAQGLKLGYIDSFDGVHIFLDEEFMSRAYGCKHNNVEAINYFIGKHIHIYSFSQEYLNQIRQSILNRLLLIKKEVSTNTIDDVFHSQRGAYKSLTELESADTKEEDFFRNYDFDQSMKSYIVSLDSEFVSRLSIRLGSKAGAKMMNIASLISKNLKLNLKIVYKNHGYNNGEWEMVDIHLPDGNAPVIFYEKSSLNKWNKAVVQHTSSILARLVVPFFLVSIREANNFDIQSHRNLEMYG